MEYNIKKSLQFFINNKCINLDKLYAKLEAIVKLNLNRKSLTDPNTGKTIQVDDRIQFCFFDKELGRKRPFCIKNPYWSKDVRDWFADEVKIGYYDLNKEAYYV